MQADDLVSCPGVLALEVSMDAPPRCLSLERDEAETLAGFMADDLRKLLPDVERGKLAVTGAHFDSIELLRPQFPVFSTLEGLAAHLTGDVLAFGTRDGHMPAQPLVPDPALAGGAMRIVPWTVLAPPALAGKLGPDMENELVGRGEAGAATADFLMRTLDMRLEHARYFSLHDLMALVDVHYQHANLMALWTMVELALLNPERTGQETSARGMAWRYADHHVIAQTPGQWLAAQPHRTDERRAHDLAGIVFELRQYITLLRAHRIALVFDTGTCDAGESCVVDHQARPDPALGAVRLYAHEAPGLGVVAISVAQQEGSQPRILANAWPLSPGLEPVYRYLADTYGSPLEPDDRGALLLGADGALAVPAATLH